jgi:hypothetical protein
VQFYWLEVVFLLVEVGEVGFLVDEVVVPLEGVILVVLLVF